MFLSQNRRACSDAAHQWQHERRKGAQGQSKACAASGVDGAHGVGTQADATGGAADQINDAFAGQCLQVFFSGIGRLEAEGAGNLSARRWRTSARDAGLDEVQNLLLAGGELGVI